MFKWTRLPVEIVCNEVYAFIELRGQPEDQAIASVLESFPTTSGGAEAIRQLLAYREAHKYQPAL